MEKNKIFDEKTQTLVFRITVLFLLVFILAFLMSCEVNLKDLAEYFIEYRGLG